MDYEVHPATTKPKERRHTPFTIAALLLLLTTTATATKCVDDFINVTCYDIQATGDHYFDIDICNKNSNCTRLRPGQKISATEQQIIKIVAQDLLIDDFNNTQSYMQNVATADTTYALVALLMAGTLFIFTIGGLTWILVQFG